MTKYNFKIFKLHFKSPLHIGDKRPNEYGSSEKIVRSDTLYSALTAMQALIDFKLIPKNGKPGYFISSLFPFTTNQNHTIYFFPKLLKPFNLLSDSVDYSKKLKKIKWLDKKYFEYHLNNDPIKSFGHNNEDIKGELCTSANIDEKFMTSQVTQRVTISRIRTGADDDPTPFYMERLFFKNESGLYFLFKGNDLQLENIRSTLNLLCLEGLGTDRTIGNGFFDYTESELSLRVPDETPYFTNLSLMCPSNLAEWKIFLGMTHENDKIDTNVAFQLIKRGGWITSGKKKTFRKRSIYMLEECGIFKSKKTYLTAGKEAIDLTPEEDWIRQEIGHPIWRNGSSIILPVKL